ncbi:uncharacterized protein LOC116171893 [Photinus pyralis]|uniref:uncharacterized protein LOC116171893 n=1 Tax=Photinus pyralis TaxID=7054 RepID=UPI0012672840|nr:uncharacterized protein LOC116171893 [Photinus pyralis]
MSRYKRKSDRKLVFTEENLEDIKRKITEGCSKRSIAREMGINEATLRKRLKCGTIPKSLGRFRSDIPENMEIELAQQVRDLDSRFYGITKKNLQIAAFKFAQVNNIQHRFNKITKMAGPSWIKGFCHRHNISLRQPEKCTMGRIMGFNKVQVNRFYENLKILYEKRKYIASSVYNMDETGLSTVPNKLPKVLSSKGKKLVGKVASADRGQLVTAVCCMSATGTYIPPAMIFPRKRMKEELFLNAPTGTYKMVSESGFINTELFCQWLVHFKNCTKPSAENPILLILDNHSSHRDLQAIQYCRENHIDLLSLPPHASHKMQPLDVGFFGPLKNSYSRECDKWMTNNPGKVITQIQVAGLFNIAYTTVANIQKAENSFKATGIYPYNPDKFDDLDFAPSLVTDFPTSSNTNENNVTEAMEQNVIINTVLSNNQPNEEISEAELSIPLDITPPPVSNDVMHVTPSLDIINSEIVCEDGVVIPNTLQGVEENYFNQSIPVSDILPLPQIQDKPNRCKSRSQKSEILSSTPFKNELEELVQAKTTKQERKADKMKRKLVVSSSGSGTSRKQQKKKHNDKDEKDVSCPGCGELYSKSQDDWIKCSECNKWWEESCTTYVTGNFVCASCEE